MSSNDEQDQKQEEKVSTNPQDVIAVASELLEILTYDEISNAIVETLIKSRIPDGLHYNQLFRETQVILKNSETSEILTGKQGKKTKSLNWKPFNERLKRLVEIGIVARIEESRYSVKYQVPFIKELNNETMDLTLRTRMHETEMLLRNCADDLRSILRKQGSHFKQANKENRVKGTEGVIRTLLYTIVYHTLICMFVGVVEGQKGRFVRLSSALVNSYRDIMTAVLLITFYVSVIPEAKDCLKTISKELDKNSGVKWEWPWPEIEAEK